MLDVIRKTLPATKAATFAVCLPGGGWPQYPRPAGTGFFVSPDGWFVTAAHVVSRNGSTRPDIDKAWLTQPVPGGSDDEPGVLESPALSYIDHRLDIALLKVDRDRNAARTWVQEHKKFPHVRVSVRQLEEGEPVYSYGYPLSGSELKETSGGFVYGATHCLSPRATSAIVASTVEYIGPEPSPPGYVIDKALNYGNSGGAVLATETGHVHAICSRFQPLPVRQEHIKDADGKPLTVWMPSLYGFAASLAAPAVIAELEARGISISDS